MEPPNLISPSCQADHHEPLHIDQLTSAPGTSVAQSRYAHCGLHDRSLRFKVMLLQPSAACWPKDKVL